MKYLDQVRARLLNKIALPPGTTFSSSLSSKPRTSQPAVLKSNATLFFVLLEKMFLKIDMEV